MKKQFFYAAFALAMMASCTSEDNLSVDPITPDADDKVAIELGIDAPTVSTVVGRAVGSVGDVAGDKNKWNGEQLFIAMVNKETKELATEKDANGNDVSVLDHLNYVYYAPRATENSGSGLIRIYKEANKPTTNEGQGTLSHVYYPVSGQYDFYGWHLDDASGATVKIDETEKTVKGITITGQQDIMGARTKEFTEANYFTGNPHVTVAYEDMVGWDFSARTARNEINPILKFEHQLARLKFFVKAGSDKTAEYKYNENSSSWDKNIAVGSADESTAMKVTSIKALKMIDVIDMNLDGTKDGKPAVVTSSTDTEDATFTLGSKDGNVMGGLEAIAPKYYYNGNATPVAPVDNDYDDHKNGTQVGESIMFFPGETSKNTIELEISLSQWVRVLEDENNPSAYDEAHWAEKTQTTPLKVHASSLINQTDGAAKLFEPGKSYNIYITVYGFERIEITAELTAWEIGGDVNVDVEEGESRHEASVEISLTDANGALSDATITAPYTYKDAAGNDKEGEATFTESTTTAGLYEAKVPSFAVLNYTITKDGYKTETGYMNARNSNNVAIIMKRLVDASFNATGIAGTITVKDASGNVVEPETGGGYKLAEGETYKYTISKNGYKTISGVIVPEFNTPITIDYTLEQLTTYTVTFEVADTNPTALGGVEITISDPLGLTVQEVGNGTYTVEVPNATTQISYTASKTGYQDVTGTDVTVSAESALINVTMQP